MSAQPREVDPNQRLDLARSRFFRDSGFPADGGYDDAWSEAQFGPLPYRVPNFRSRAAALKRHDLHHLATGYATDWRGESEISAWELGSGGGGQQPYAWVIALWGLFTGLIALPQGVFRAFVRGRRSRNLYEREFTPALLDATVGELQALLNVQPPAPMGEPPWPPNASLLTRLQDRLAFSGWGAVAMAWGATAGVLALGMVGLALVRPVFQGLRCPCTVSAAA
jgi:hypothetical protein